MTNSHADTLLAKIRNHDAIVGIIGMGYVGLPLALAFVEKGFAVLGFDVDPEKVAKLGRGEGYIKHLDGGRLAAAVATGRLQATCEFARLGEPDAILICVPTPLTPQREPDMTYVVASARQVKACLRPGQLVVLESTTYPGTTDELLRSILEAPVLRHPEGAERPKDPVAPGAPLLSGHTEKQPVIARRPEADLPISSRRPDLLCGDTFFLAFSPEREDPGRKDFTTTTTPKVVGGVDELSGDLVPFRHERLHALLAGELRQ
jgi:UDP-N-acetyl-D-glucosamine dehydrogenase